MWVAPPPKLKDVTALESLNNWISYEELCKASFKLLE